MNTSITPLIQYHPGVVAVKALVHDKTQLMLISRRADFAPKRPNIQPRDPASNLRKKLRYLVLISTKTSETVRNTEKTAYVASLASMPVGTRHYKSQVNPVLENSSCVVAMSSVVPEPFGENPGQSKTSDSEETDVNASFNTAVAATMSECFWLVYKVYKQHSSPGITAPPTIPACALQYQVGTKRENTLKVPFARTELCLRPFLPKYGRVWNTLMETTAIGQAKPLTNFKARINTWIKEQPP